MGNSDIPGFLAGHIYTSPMARRIASHEWGELGSPSGWPAALASTTSLMLGSLSPMFVCWGPDLTLVYNDAYANLLGERDAHALGNPYRDCWPDIWHALEPLTEATLKGQAFQAEDTPFELVHDGVARRVHYSFSASPLRELDGTIAGIFCVCSETTERAAAAAALKEAESRLNALSENLPGGVAFQIACGRDNSWRRFTYLSSKFEALFGIPREDVVADPEAIYGRIPAQFRAAVDEAEARNVRELLPFDGVVPLLRPDGRMVWGRSISAPRFQPDGTLVFDGIMLDETARQEAEFKLRESEARFQAIVDSIEQMVWSAGPEGEPDFYNQRWHDFTGLPRDTFGGEAWDGLVHPEDEATRAQWQASLESGDPYRAEYRLRDAMGRYRWVLARAQPVRRDDGSILRWFGTYTDIDDIVEAREVLARSRATLEREVADRSLELDRVWRLSRDLLAVMDADGVHRRVNPSWEGLLGHDGRDVPGMPFRSLVHAEDRGLADAALRRASEGETVRDVILRMSSKDGSSPLHDWTFVPEGDAVYATGRDVSHQRITEEALRQAQKMEAVGQLTGGLAHDFNNLLTGIVGSLELMQSRVAQGRYDSIPRYAAAAMSSANRAAALTHRLLAFARRQPLDSKAVDVNRLVASLDDLVRRTIGESVSLKTVTAAGTWPTLCDPHQLESALLNLAINARDAMPDGGAITVTAGNATLDSAYVRTRPGVEPGQYVKVSVSDTGTGMTPDVLERAFDPFYTTKPLGQGTGLGLSMIYGFARQSGGHAVIETEVGKGTTVSIFLPRHRGAVSATDEEGGVLTDELRAEAGQTVLVVEDEGIVRDLVVEVLGDLGYAARQAHDGPSGLEALLAPGRIDLLVSDVGLPGFNGRQMVDQARVARPDLKVLFVTGYAENAMFGNGDQDPNTQLITKPFTVEVLASKIKDMLGA